MPFECLRTDTLITRAVAGRASEAELLRLDAHLEACAVCREKQAAFETLRHLQLREAPGLSAAARERVRRKLFDTAPAPAAASTPRRRPAPWAVAAAAAAACIGAVVVVVAAPWQGRTVLPDAASSPPAATGSAGGAEEATVLRPGPAGVVVLDDAVVELEPGTDALWRPAARTVELRSGAVTVDVSPGRGHGFRVQTPGFAVKVAGTRFRVDLGGVVTERGRVLVLGRDDHLLAEVSAGSEWCAAATTSQPVAAAPAPPPPRVNGTRAPSEKPTRPAAELLAEARHALAVGRVADARALVRPLLTERPTVAVEAHSALAESYLVAHQYAAAIRRYRTVARAFDGTPQAESALYAIGQLESERGDRGAAARALVRYLARYPTGRYAGEARARLARLTGRER